MKIPSSVGSKGFPAWPLAPPRILIPSFSPGCLLMTISCNDTQPTRSVRVAMVCMSVSVRVRVNSRASPASRGGRGPSAPACGSPACWPAGLARPPGAWRAAGRCCSPLGCGRRRAARFGKRGREGSPVGVRGLTLERCFPGARGGARGQKRPAEPSRRPWSSKAKETIFSAGFYLGDEDAGFIDAKRVTGMVTAANDAQSERTT